MRFATDTGGTFTDLVVEDDDGNVQMFKASTTPDDPIRGVLDVLQIAADQLGLDRADMLGKGDLFIHGTTRAINAIVTDTAAKTALLTTWGNPEVLVLREGGRIEPFNFTVPYPKPYIPRSLTFEVVERVLYDGTIDIALDEAAAIEIIAQLKVQEVEAVAVSLLWSVVNPIHEKRLGELLAEHLPGVPFTLSHEVNPILREYRRTSAAAIDASLKPLMTAYMETLEARLRDAGFAGRVLVLTSQGGVLDAADVAKQPIHSINSGPSMAPVAGRYFALADVGASDAIVADTGGTTYDVSLIRGGSIPWARDTWIGQPFRGHMTGFPSIDVKSVGAGGGSIASVDAGGLLSVGPRSAGSVPGPVCYGNGGTEPTVTDAALVLGYLNPENFLGGAITLDLEAARHAVETKIAKPLNLSIHDAAAAILDVVTENMVQAIDDITVAQGFDPAQAVLVGGGGAAGFNCVLIARRLGCKELIMPQVGAALSAGGGLISELTNNFRVVAATRTDEFDHEVARSALAELTSRANAFLANTGDQAIDSRMTFSIEGHYPSQVWDIEVPLPQSAIDGEAGVAALEEAFHQTHEKLFAVRDDGSPVEIVGWRVDVAVKIRSGEIGQMHNIAVAQGSENRRCFFRETGVADVPLVSFADMHEDSKISGPAIVESPFTTVVVFPGSEARKVASGSVVIEILGENA
ncbi:MULTISPECIES: hydantoinase/oxoprolinase family protein [Mesorhizobium]|uniref:Hydantoinase/oxoprolinase family protein n=1 Tax=Mesorhizobium denitrificans TaxID=2294114 RepID=A0A371XG57_9HYPH|nr:MULTISPECIES: hydantoinase/oxoprolinase family protein [Mesorhizobium]RFC68014.1 hydantoinase/oxoprolinase family protein [Mesorhizobium denitrificans]